MKYVYRLGKLVPKDAAAYTGVTRLRSKMSFGGQARGPYVLRDEMPATEQVDGKFYTSKAKFRAKGRELGLIEVGNEKLPPKKRTTETPEYKKGLRETMQRIMEEYRSGRRPYPDQDSSRRTTPRWR